MKTLWAFSMRKEASVAGIACLFAVQFVCFMEGRGLSSMLLNLPHVAGAFCGGILCGAVLFSLRSVRSWAGIASTGVLTAAGAMLWATSTDINDTQGFIACMTGGMLLPPLLNRLFDTYPRPGAPLGLAFGMGDFFWLFLYVLPIPPTVHSIQIILACLHVGSGLLTMLSLWQQRTDSLALEHSTPPSSALLRHNQSSAQSLPPVEPLLRESLYYLVLMSLIFISLSALIDISFYRIHEADFAVPRYVHLYIWIVYPLAGLYIDRCGSSIPLLLCCLGGTLLSLLSAYIPENNIVYWIIYFIGIGCRVISLMYLTLVFSKYRSKFSCPCVIVSLPHGIMFLTFLLAYEWIQRFQSTSTIILLSFVLAAVFSYDKSRVQYAVLISEILNLGKHDTGTRYREKAKEYPVNTSYFSKKYGITSREQDVLQLIIEGYDTSQMGEALYLSENTIKSHVRQLLRKTETRNRIALTALVFNEARKGPNTETNVLEEHRELPAQ